MNLLRKFLSQNRNLKAAAELNVRQRKMHDVKAVIANFEILKQFQSNLESGVVCPLPQGFGLLPITDVLMKQFRSHSAGIFSFKKPPIAEIPCGLLNLIFEISQLVPVAYITTEYFGGSGGQDAAAWKKGKLLFSPSSVGYEKEWPNSSISQALRAIGVIAEINKDEFDSLGLGNYRETHKWAESINRTA